MKPNAVLKVKHATWASVVVLVNLRGRRMMRSHWRQQYSATSVFAPNNSAARRHSIAAVYGKWPLVLLGSTGVTDGLRS